jgi:hypothetical protein
MAKPGDDPRDVLPSGPEERDLDPPFGRAQRDRLNVRISREYKWAREADEHGLSEIQKAERKKGLAEATPKEIFDRHTSLMRARRVRPEILEAIIAVRGHNNPENHPYSVAESLLPRVNAWLKKHDHKPVLVDALAKRIPHT